MPSQAEIIYSQLKGWIIENESLESVEDLRFLMD